MIANRIRTPYGYSSWEISPAYAHIHTLWVIPKHRRQGHARELIQTALDQIRAAGFEGSVSIVASPKENLISLDNLRAFYESMGLDVFDFYG